MHKKLVSLSSRPRLLRFVYIKYSPSGSMFVNKSPVNYCVRGGLIDHNISVILHYYLNTSHVAVVCGPDRVVGDTSYCKVMQCVTSCRRSIMQCEHSSD